MIGGDVDRPGGMTISKHIMRTAVVIATLIANQHMAPATVGITMSG